MADKVKDRLINLCERLKDKNVEQLPEWIQDTIDLLNKHGARTVDELAEKLSYDRSEAARKQVEMAKRVMTFLFLDTEDSAIEEAFPSYACLFREMFSAGKSSTIEDRMRNTNCRVLTFNYDRLFEKCLLRWAAEYGKRGLSVPATEELIQIIGGVSLSGDKPKDASSWLLLKLHGSIAQFHPAKDDAGIWFRCDDELKLSVSAPNLENPYYLKWEFSRQRMSTMFFPHEKELDEDSLRERGAGFPFPYYEKLIWSAAKTYCSEATEIHIIGYSMQDIDWFSFKTLLSESRTDCRIVVRNLCLASGDLRDKIDWLKVEFGKNWIVEFREEEFYAKRVIQK